MNAMNAIAPRVERLALDAIRVDGGTQIRVETDITQAEGYAEDMNAGAAFPPIVVFFDGAEYWLADGFHRLIAAQVIKRTEIDAEIHEGGRRDAILFAVGCNASHGLKRSNRDKRNAVRKLLEDPEWSEWVNEEIARRCIVSPHTVARERATLQMQSDRRTYTNKDGVTATMNTANIGARPVAVDAVPEPEWRQTDIEDIAPSPARLPRFPPEHTAPAGQIRYFISELDRRLTLTPAQAAAAFVGEIHSDAGHVARVLSWLVKFQGELHAELSRREGSEAAD